jgi:hypothetical protein
MSAHSRTIVCDENNLACVHRECFQCRGKLAYNVDRLTASLIHFYQWEKTTNASGYVNVGCAQVSPILQASIYRLFSLENTLLYLFLES